MTLVTSKNPINQTWTKVCGSYQAEVMVVCLQGGEFYLKMGKTYANMENLAKVTHSWVSVHN